MMDARHDGATRLLVVDDDVRYRQWLRHHLDVLCPHADVSVLSLAQFERWCSGSSGCDLAILAAGFGSSPEDPLAHGLTLLRALRKRPAAPAVIVLAQDGNELTAVRALQLGAVDYLPKRLLTPERLNTAIRVALRRLEGCAARRRGSAAPPARVAATGTAASEPETVEEMFAAHDVAPQHDSHTGGTLQSPLEQAFAAGAAAEPLQPVGVAALLAAANAEVIPGYTLRLKVGESEKATVYLAHSAALDQRVALKVSKTQLDEVTGRQFLEREYTAVMSIRSPRVVEIYDYGVYAGFEYLAMEYLPHGDLKARIQRGMSKAQAWRYVGDIAAALQVVHSAGLVHRDLKPPNVMLREDDSVALIDFGLARPLDGGTLSTQTGVLLGSPYYMSPEQALGEPLDARSDFYSLGIICYEMLAGHKPYTGATAMEVLQQHVSGPVPVLPRALERYQPFLQGLLAKSRSARFDSAAQIIAALDQLHPAIAVPARSAGAAG